MTAPRCRALRHVVSNPATLSSVRSLARLITFAVHEVREHGFDEIDDGNQLQLFDL